MMGIRAFLIAVLGALLLLHFLKQRWSRRHYPPGPLSLPLIGNIWRMGFRFTDDILLKLAKQYGSIFTLWLGYQPSIVMSGYQAVKEALIDHSDEFADRPVTSYMKLIGKNKGIVLSNGHTWKQQRRFGLVTLRKLGLGKTGLEHRVEEEAQQLVETFARSKGQPLDPSFAITNAISNVICGLCFGHRFSLEDKEFQKLIEAIHDSLAVATTSAYLLYEIFPSIMKHLPGPHQKGFTARDTVLSLAKKEIEEHKVQKSFHDPQDYIDFYLLKMEKHQRKNEPNSTYNDENLAQSIHDLFIAGTDTAATTMQWALLLLTNHPDVQDKAYKEIEDVLSSSSSICYQDKKKLPYVNAVIHEIQRSKYVLFFGIPRQSTKDVKINGLTIPKGVMIFPDLRSVLVDPEHWETPEKFNPNHFLDKDGNFVAREEFLAFGAGARVCLGELLAKVDLFIFLTCLLRNFKFQLPEGVKELNEEPITGVTRHTHPYKICAIPRCSPSQS
ncbi:cytochrome P450 2C39-like [Elgaria multicarinata webbii]|uniref:cytochrome P450 2C39-like n=1 Tax=Elgaria multicarinata webbii TaxID=159646 RepID=UPI002FCD5E55